MDDLFQRINQLLTNADEQMTLWDLLISHLITYCNAISSGLQRQESIATSNFGQASSMNNIHFLLSLQQHSSIQALCKQSQSILYKIYKVQAAIENQNKQAEIALSHFFDKNCPNFEDQLDMYSSELSYKVNLLKQLARDYKLQYVISFSSPFLVFNPIF